jgi:hypothetical protein
MPYNGPAVQAMGGGWANALNAVVQLRAQDRPAPNVYYYGLVAPGMTLKDYCPMGCVGGVANVPPSTTSTGQFASMGVSYHEGKPEKNLDDISVRVALQEIAHDFGRLHAFCVVPEGGVPSTGNDNNYPYKTGSIGNWGYDIVQKKLFDPMKYFDIQSYCNPVFISDYTFSAIFDWVTKVNAMAPIQLEDSIAQTAPVSEDTLRYFRIE